MYAFKNTNETYYTYSSTLFFSVNNVSQRFFSYLHLWICFILSKSCKVLHCMKAFLTRLQLRDV